MGCPSVLGDDFGGTVVAGRPLSLLLRGVSGASGSLFSPSPRVLSEAGVTAPASPGLVPGSAGWVCAEAGGEGAVDTGRHDPCRRPFSAALRVEVEQPPHQTAREGSSSECSSSSPSPMGVQAREESSDSAEENDRRKDARPGSALLPLPWPGAPC